MRIRFENHSDRPVELALAHLDPEAMEGLRAAALTLPEALVGVLTVTSAADGQHSPGSLHAIGRAWDLRTTGLGDKDLSLWVHQLTKMLHGDWQVVLESDHIHIERDR